MVLLSWSHECIVGVEAMDDQHAILMDSLNELRLSLVHGSERKKVCQQLERLIEFTQMHFENEEQLLIQEGFPGDCRNIAPPTSASCPRFRQSWSKPGITMRLSSNRCSIFFAAGTDHVQGLDQSYGTWLNERGVF